MHTPIDWHSAPTCLQLIRWLLFISLTISSFQNLSNSTSFSPDGLFAWKYLKYAHPEKWMQHPILDKLFGQTGIITVNLARLGLLAAGFTNHALPLVLTALLLISALLYIRAFLPMSAADQLNTILLFCLTVNAWLPDLATITLFAIAGQVLCCYFLNGLLKAKANKWWNGAHLKDVLQTENYSRKWVVNLASKTSGSAFRLPGGVIVIWELSAIITPLLPPALLWIYLGIGIAFHLFNAVVMGLNTFFWSFISSYPAILFTHYYLFTH
jgi:hypothetical protein